MIPTIEQLRSMLMAVSALHDPLVRWEPTGAFRDPEAPKWVPNPAVIYVSDGVLSGAVCFVVKRYFRDRSPPNTEALAFPREIVRWHYALPPFSHPLDLPPLAVAVAMQRLPDTSFPRPGSVVEVDGVRGGVRYLDDGKVCVGGELELPLWRLLQKLGTLDG